MNRHGNANKPRLHRKATVNRSALADDDDEFFDSRERISSVVALDLAAPSGSPHGDDSGLSFATAVSSSDFRCLSGHGASTSLSFVPDYNVWIAEPEPIDERRKWLFHGMGFSNKDFFQRSSMEYKRVASKKMGKGDAGRVGRMLFDGSISDGEINDRKEHFFVPALKQRVARTSTILTGPCAAPGSNFSKSSLLKNISRSVSTSMNGLKGDRERETLPPMPHLIREPKFRHKVSTGPEWVRVREHGKSYKELSALQLCQEIQAHEGPIWTIRFSLDAHYLASAGEDRVIHVWEVQECDVGSTGQPEEWTLTPLHASAVGSDGQFSGPELMESALPVPPFELKKKGRGSLGRKKSMPDYVYVPETVFGLSERPVCSFQGHLDDVLDLSWSKSQLLLSSSMDKTVRLWDLESGSCLKSFAHSDYVTCIQFNPVDEDYFISGSLDAKVRIWSIPDCQVVDWSDLREMITAVCYTPDGQGAIIGTHQGGIRVFNAEDCKLDLTTQLDLQNKKTNLKKKITGFQFSQWNPSEVIVTSSDSRIRLLEGSNPIYQFKGLKNSSSQIAASFTPDGNYIVCASEDSQVFVWKRDQMPRNSSSIGKSKHVKVTSCESFVCKDVAMAIPWPGTIRHPTPPLATRTSKRHWRRPSSGPPPQSTTGSPSREATENLGGGNKESSKKNRPSLPKKTNEVKDKSSERSIEESRLTRPDSETGIRESISSSSGRFVGESQSISSEMKSASALWGEYNGSGIKERTATAWGMVIVAAGLGGEIRAYQNFGLPRRVGRQANLFNVLRNQLLATKNLCCA